MVEVIHACIHVSFCSTVVKQKALTRLQYEKLDKHPDIVLEGSPYYKDPVGE